MYKRESQGREGCLLATEATPCGEDIHVSTVNCLDTVTVSVCLAAGLATFAASNVEAICAVVAELGSHG